MQEGVLGAYEESQLVVSTPDLGVVLAALGEFRVGFEERPGGNARLGLTLVELDSVAAGAGTSQERSALVEDMTAGRPRSAGAAAAPSDLDILIFRLREKFRADYDQWVPAFGKNRVISPVRGFPYVGGGGSGDPYAVGSVDPAPSPGTGHTSGTEAARLDAPQSAWHQRPPGPGQGARIGLLDTPLYAHEWLAGAYFTRAHDLIDASAAKHWAPPASEGHGTFVAGLILRQAPGAELIVRPVLGVRAVGRLWEAANMMADYVGSGVHILNLSFGCYTDDGQPPLALARAVSLLSSEMLLVAAAGNHGDIDDLRKRGVPLPPWTTGLSRKTPAWPAAMPEVTAVGATDGNGRRASFSPDVPWVDVTAPGVGVESTYLAQRVRLEAPRTGSPAEQDFFGFARWDGTSFAAATVSGAVASKIGPGRDARQALSEILATPGAVVRRFPHP